MSYLAKYHKKDFKRVTWDEYGKTLERLYTKVSRYLKQNNLKVDAVVPILRGGSVPAQYLASRLKILRMLPIQYKYFFVDKNLELRKIMDTIPLAKNLPKNPVFLLVEGDHCFGITATNAAKDLKEHFPACRIIYAVDHLDYSYQKVGGAEIVLGGLLTNETRALTPSQAKKHGVYPLSYLLPWAELDEEWTTVNAQQVQYQDLDAVMKNAKTKEIIENE